MTTRRESALDIQFAPAGFDARSMKEQRDAYALAWMQAEQELVELRDMVKRLLVELKQEVGA